MTSFIINKPQPPSVKRLAIGWTNRDVFGKHKDPSVFRRAQSPHTVADGNTDRKQSGRNIKVFFTSTCSDRPTRRTLTLAANWQTVRCFWPVTDVLWKCSGMKSSCVLCLRVNTVTLVFYLVTAVYKFLTLGLLQTESVNKWRTLEGRIKILAVKLAK